MSIASNNSDEQVLWKVDDIDVEATLTRPGGDGPFPAIALVAGSGPTDRNWNSPVIPGTNGSAALLAQVLTDQNFITLRYDKRASGPHLRENMSRWLGKISMQSHLAELAGGVLWLATRSEVDPKRLFALANSEGCIHALNYQLQATEFPFAGLILTGAAARSIGEVARGQIAAQLAAVPGGDKGPGEDRRRENAPGGGGLPGARRAGAALDLRALPARRPREDGGRAGGGPMRTPPRPGSASAGTMRRAQAAADLGQGEVTMRALSAVAASSVHAASLACGREDRQSRDQIRAEILALEKERDSLRERVNELMVNDPRVARMPDTPVRVGVPTTLARDLIQRVVAGFVDQVTLELKNLKVKKSGTVRKVVTIGQYDLRVTIHRVTGKLKTGKPEVTFGGDKVAIALPVTVVSGTGQATIHFKWDGKNVAGATCGDMG